jgi:hypothetical protein
MPFRDKIFYFEKGMRLTNTFSEYSGERFSVRQVKLVYFSRSYNDKLFLKKFKNVSLMSLVRTNFV